MVARGREGGSALLVVILITFLGAIACQAWYQVMAAGLASLRREEQQVRLTALSDAAVAMCLARLHESPGFVGTFSRRVGAGSIRVEVRHEEDGSTRAVVTLDERGSELVLRLRIHQGGGGAEVVGWEVVSGRAPTQRRQPRPSSHAS
jgi:hypothetical protein